jgi:hypothetical protein
VDITEKLEQVAEHKVDILAKALVCYEAKDEIERLRADRDKWKKTAFENMPSMD